MKRLKRLLSLLLALALLGSIPVSAKSPGVSQTVDYTSADAIFEKIDALGEGTQNTASMTDRVYALVSKAEGVIPGSAHYEGTDRVTWMTEDGVSCVYSDYYAEIAARCTPCDMAAAEEAEPQAITHGKDVYLIEPYYGIDKSFTGQYQREAAEIASTLGGRYYLRATSNATIDKVAKALESGGLVIFDSHGNTNYKSGADTTSGATTSYLCLSTREGVTAQDYADGHANYSVLGGIVFCEVDGVAITNHMTKNAENSMVWAAICLGMATDGLCTPLQERGVAVMYGYSQSVSFGGDYCFEEAFFDSMLAGKDVAGSIKDMKQKYGCWDYSPEIARATGTPGYSTIEDARRNRCAFPIVASKEDTYPGHGNVDDLQEVYSTWRLVEQECTHNLTEIRDAREPSCFVPGYTGDTWCRVCGEKIAEGQEIPVNSDHCPLKEFPDVKLDAWYHEAVEYAVGSGIMKGTGKGFEPGKPMTRAQLATVFWNLAGNPEPEGACPFADVAETFWGAKAITWAAEQGIVNGMGGGKFAPNATVTREQVAVMLCRCAGGTAPEGDFLSAFQDGDKVSSWATDAMNWAVSQSILRGSSGKLNPGKAMSRSELAQLMMNYLK